MADTSDERSGSRWEPDTNEQPTEQLGQPTEVIPGIHAEEPAAPAPKRRIPRFAGAVAIVAAATIGGGVVGMALAGNQTQEVTDTVTTTEDGTQQFDGDGFAPGRDADGDGFGRHFGHGPGGH